MGVEGYACNLRTEAEAEGWGWGYPKKLKLKGEKSLEATDNHWFQYSREAILETRKEAVAEDYRSWAMTTVLKMKISGQGQEIFSKSKADTTH